MRKVRTPRKNVTLKYADLKNKYEHICECLIKDEKFETLIFFKMGVELRARQSELVEITFKQIDLANLKVHGLIDSKIRKVIPAVSISKELGELIEKYMYGADDEKLFKKPVDFYKDHIKESTGDGNFTIFIMRHMGIMFSTERIEDILFKYRNELKRLNFEIVHTSGLGWISIRTDYQNYSNPIKQFNTPEEMEAYIVSQIAAENQEK